MSNVHSGLSKFPWKRKTRKLQVTSYARQTVGCNTSLKIHFLHPNLTSSLRHNQEGKTTKFIRTGDGIGKEKNKLLPSEPGRSDRRKWERVAPRRFLHGDKICRKVVTER
jgi:hypothetical protein